MLKQNFTIEHVKIVKNSRFFQFFFQHFSNCSFSKFFYLIVKFKFFGFFATLNLLEITLFIVFILIDKSIILDYNKIFKKTFFFIINKT